MGILNVTPDSFSDGGHFFSVDAAVQHALNMAEEGATIIDIGGESTRPGAAPVSAQEEIDRVLPVIEALRGNLTVTMSIDTRKPEVMRGALAAGVRFINDVTALGTPEALQIAVLARVPVCLMHMAGEPHGMQTNPVYQDVVGEVKAFLAQRIAACVAAGIARDLLIIDPGFGFGKTLQHNLTLLRRLEEFSALGVPLLIGLSRKSMIGTLLGGAAPAQRVVAGAALTMTALSKGATLIRTHDVRATCDVIKMHEALTSC
ncbi:MAG: dihydropteroate synthase [Gammaproteobacteria bacterium]|nr:dihydropteroate synthase [Gammaproteobacteria bacterium]